MAILDSLKNLIFNNNDNAVGGITPVQDMSALGRFGLYSSGPTNVANYEKSYQDAQQRDQLAKLGMDLSSGNIDQSQYLKGVAQYNPELYGKLALAQVSNGTPAALQVNSAIQKALDSKDYDTANRLAWLQRSQAYGVNTFGPGQTGGQVPGIPAPTSSVAAPQSESAPETFNVASENLPATSPIAAQIAANAAAKKKAEADATNKSDLAYKPDIAYKTEAEKQKAEREGIEPKELETKRTQAYVAALEAAPLLKTLKDLNEGTVDAPYAAAFQPFLKMTDSQKATNLDLMKQARLELAAPLAKQLGVNPTDKDFEASLDRIFDISSTKDSRAAQIKNLTTRIMDKPNLYGASDKGTQEQTKVIGKNTYVNKNGKWYQQ